MKQIWFEDDRILEKLPISPEKIDSNLKSETNRRTKNFIIIPNEY